MRRVGAEIEAQMRRVLRPEEVALLDDLVDLDRWPEARISIKAKGRRGSIGKWGRVVDLPDWATILLMRLAAARDPEAWDRAVADEQIREQG